METGSNLMMQCQQIGQHLMRLHSETQEGKSLRISQESETAAKKTKDLDVDSQARFGRH